MAGDKMLQKLLYPEIRELIAAQDQDTLRETLDRWLPADVASLFAELSSDEDLAGFRLLRGPQRVQVFEYLERPAQRELLSRLDPAEAGSLLNDMAADDRTALLASLDDDDRARYLRLLDDEHRTITQSLLQFSEGTVGRLMSPDYVAVRAHWTIQHVLEHIRRHGHDSETLNVVYVVDADNHLIDDLRIRQVLLADPLQTIQTLMDENFVALSANDPKRSAVEVFRRYDRSALPVIDADGKLLGVVTIDDVLDVAVQAGTQDFQKFGGVEALSDPYAATPLLVMVRKRASWLVVLFLGELLTATAMGYFEKEIAKAVVLALFVPLIISSGGNSGSQAATLIVRSLGIGEIHLRDWANVFSRELISGCLLGLVLGTIGFLRIGIWKGLAHIGFMSDIYGPHWFLIAVTVGLSLVGIVLWGTLSGAMLPFLLKRAGLDPATSSAPFVATLVDVTGLVIYFSVAMVVLRGTLL